MVNDEKIRLDRLKIGKVVLSPEFQKKIEDAKLQITKLDVSYFFERYFSCRTLILNFYDCTQQTINIQDKTLEKLEKDFKNIQLNVLNDLIISTNKSENYLNVFDTITNYK